jgi:Bacterial membrane protein YfhO
MTRMRHLATFFLLIASLATPLVICYGPALFLNRQFAHRDSGLYYYPLHLRVQREWDEGRWPLWEPEENAGMPLLGNPTAAVLYPGKLIFAYLPYAWGARIYIVAHTVLAYATMLILMRSWRTSWVGSAVAALAYAFGAPILCQYCNVIYLIGAAWLPLGFRAVDRWVRLGRRWGLIELAIVLAMQTLGGDAELSYLLGLAGALYALGIAWSKARTGRFRRLGKDSVLLLSDRARRAVLLVMIGLSGLWFGLTVFLGKWLPQFRPPGPVQPLPWMVWAPLLLYASWTLGGLGFLGYWLHRGWRFSLGITWLGLAVAAALAFALSAAQLLPVIEFMQQSWRAAALAHEIYAYSLEPFRLVELVWPNVLGNYLNGHSYWIETLNLPGARARDWVPSLYLGGITLMLALNAMSLRAGTPWQIWLTAIVVVSLVMSLGQYSSPIWATRFVAQASHSATIQKWVQDLGPLDRPDAAPIRTDGYLRNGDGGAYWWLNLTLPGFRQFRFPSKLLTFMSLGLTALAGLGWDRLASGRARGLALPSSLLGFSTLVLACVIWKRPVILAAFRASASTSAFGPFDANAAFSAIVGGLTQALIVIGLGLVIVKLIRTRPTLAGALALTLTTADLTVANARYIVTVPQALLDTRPEVLRIIDAAERDHSAAGPFRIHRMPQWIPTSWTKSRSSDRASEFVSWQRDTMLPKHGINLGVEFTYTSGVAELYDYEWFFTGFPWAIRDAKIARVLDVELGKLFFYYPRRSFDLWNTRYFIVPFDPRGWGDPYRAYASFRYQSDVLYPEPSTFHGREQADAREQWSEQSDFQILRNQHELPRAWVVHDARAIPTLRGTGQEDRDRSLLEMTYMGDLWNEPALAVFDPGKIAWLEQNKLTELAPFLVGPPPGSTEEVTVIYPTPQRAELKVKLASPGLVVLSDVHYPGWELTIDGKPAPIHRVNRMMRGAAVPAGIHQLVYSYHPRSFTAGCKVSALGAAALLVLSVMCARWPIDPIVINKGGEHIAIAPDRSL